MKPIKPLSQDGLNTLRAIEQEAKGQNWAQFYRRWLVPLGFDPGGTVMSRLRQISAEFPGGKYYGDTPKFERIMIEALRMIRESKRHQAPMMLQTGTLIELPRFKQIYSGIERNAKFTDKRRGAAYIGDTGSGKSVLCHHIATKYRDAVLENGEKMFDAILRLTCTSAWRSEIAFYQLLAKKLEIPGGPWRGLFAIQDAVGEELVRRGKVLLVVDEFQVDHNAIFKAFKWLENESLTRWFVAGNQSLYDRMTRSSKMFPNAEQFEARTLPIHRLDNLLAEDVEPFLSAYQEAGAKIEGDFDDIVDCVTTHARVFGRFNLIADTLPRNLQAYARNVWSVQTIEDAVTKIKSLHGRELYAGNTKGK